MTDESNGMGADESNGMGADMRGAAWDAAEDATAWSRRAGGVCRNPTDALHFEHEILQIAWRDAGNT